MFVRITSVLAACLSFWHLTLNTFFSDGMALLRSGYMPICAYVWCRSLDRSVYLCNYIIMVYINAKLSTDFLIQTAFSLVTYTVIVIHSKIKIVLWIRLTGMNLIESFYIFYMILEVYEFLAIQIFIWIFVVLSEVTHYLDTKCRLYH